MTFKLDTTRLYYRHKPEIDSLKALGFEFGLSMSSPGDYEIRTWPRKICGSIEEFQRIIDQIEHRIIIDYENGEMVLIIENA